MALDPNIDQGTGVIYERTKVINTQKSEFKSPVVHRLRALDETVLDRHLGQDGGVAQAADRLYVRVAEAYLVLAPTLSKLAAGARRLGNGARSCRAVC